jgi:dTDP-4-dehydrorhamnose reductase
MNLLLIGGDGQLGGVLRELVGQDHRLTSTSRQVGRPLRLDLSTIMSDTTPLHNVLNNASPEVVIVAAAMAGVEACEEDERAAMAINAEAPAMIAKAAVERGARIVFFSTDYLFDGADGPYGEDDAPLPLNAYGRSKHAGEQAVQEADPRALVIRTSHVYGPEHQGKNFAYQLADVLRKGGRFAAASDMFFTPTYNRDLGRAVLSLLVKDYVGCCNVGGPEVLTRLEWAQRLARASGLSTGGIDGVFSAHQSQRVQRPPRAGLIVSRLRSLIPDVRLLTVEDAVANWIESPMGRDWLS